MIKAGKINLEKVKDMSDDEIKNFINRLYQENDSLREENNALRKKNTQYEKERIEEKRWISRSAGVFLITHGGTPFVVVTQKGDQLKICEMEDYDENKEKKIFLG